MQDTDDSTCPTPTQANPLRYAGETTTLFQGLARRPEEGDE